MNRWIVYAVAALLAGATPTLAQKPGQPDAFAEALFDPQLVLTHAQSIGLTPVQRKTVFELLKATQTELAPLQVEMTEPALELVELLGETKVDESRVLAKTSEVLRIEAQVKMRQTALLVRIKNLLTPEQQSTLRALRRTSQKGDGAAESPTLPN